LGQPELEFQFGYRFALSRQQSVDLRLGVLGAMDVACELPGNAGSFVNPALAKAG
jgi:hypothetical protein